MSGSGMMDKLVILAAGAAAGDAGRTPEEAASFAVECYERLRELSREQRAGIKGSHMI